MKFVEHVLVFSLSLTFQSLTTLILTTFITPKILLFVFLLLCVVLSQLDMKLEIG